MTESKIPSSQKSLNNKWGLYLHGHRCRISSFYISNNWGTVMLSGLPEVTQLAGKRSRIKELQVWAPGRNGELLCLNKHSPKGRGLGWLILGRCFNFSSSRKRTNPEHWVTAAAAQDEQGTAGGNNRGFIFSSFLRSYLKLGMCKGGEEEGGQWPEKSWSRLLEESPWDRRAGLRDSVQSWWPVGTASVSSLTRWELLALSSMEEG